MAECIGGTRICTANAGVHCGIDAAWRGHRVLDWRERGCYDDPHSKRSADNAANPSPDARCAPCRTVRGGHSGRHGRGAGRDFRRRAQAGRDRPGGGRVRAMRRRSTSTPIPARTCGAASRPSTWAARASACSPSNATTCSYPDDVRARLELARAYFYAQDDLNSRREFDAIAKLDLPPAVRASVERYLDALLRREAQYTPRLRAFVEVGGGYDSNVNAGVAQADLTLPVFGPVTVADFGVKKGAGFAVVAAGATYDYPVAPGVILHASGWGSGNFYSQRIRIRPRELRRRARRKLSRRRQHVFGQLRVWRHPAGRRQLSQRQRSRRRVAPAVERDIAVVGRAAIRVDQLQRRQPAARRRPGVAGRRLSPVVAHRMAAGARPASRSAATSAARRTVPTSRATCWAPRAVVNVSPSPQWALTAGALLRAQQLRRRHPDHRRHAAATTTSSSTPASPISSPATGAPSSSTSTCATIRTSRSTSTRATSSR